MKRHSSRSRLSRRALLGALAAPLAIAALSSPAHAVTITVGSGSVLTIGAQTGSILNGFSAFTQNGSAAINSPQTQVTLTSNLTDQAGSVWTTAPQTLPNSAGFTANFTYTAAGDRFANGATFTIQNDPAGAAALGATGTGLGYAAINNSLSYQINIANPPGVGTVVNVNGLTGQNGIPYNPTTPAVDFSTGDPISVTLDYVNGFLTETLLDTITGGVYAFGYSADLNALLGGNSGYLGFTASTGSQAATQTISNFSLAFGPANNQAVNASALVVNPGGIVEGIGGSLSAPTWTINGGAVAIAGTTVSFNSFTQSAGYVAMGNITLTTGKTYTLQGGSNLLANLTLLSGGSFSQSGGTFTTTSLSNAGSVSITNAPFTASGPSTNTNQFNATSATLTFGAGPAQLVNSATMTLANTNVYGDLHNTAPATLTTSGAVAFFGNLTSDGPALTANGSVQLYGPANSLAAITGSGSLSVQPAASLTSDGITLPSLTVSGTAAIRPNGTATGTSKVNTLTITGSTGNWTGSLDITNNQFIVQDSTTHATTLATLQNQVAYAQTHNAGILSSTLAPNQTLVVSDNALANLATFGGLPVDSNSILLTAALNGDTNFDGTVNAADFNTLAANFNQPATDWSQGDFNGDGVVNFADFAILSNNFGASLSPAFAPANQTLASPAGVPEPATLLLLGTALPALLSRRRRPSRRVPRVWPHPAASLS